MLNVAPAPSNGKEVHNKYDTLSSQNIISDHLYSCDNFYFNYFFIFRRKKNPLKLIRGPLFYKSTKL
jgi:hypothetical protein